MILSFADRHTQALFGGDRPRRFPPDILERARKKLRQLHVASRLTDLEFPPGNRLEALAGDRRGQHSLRINDQWRICFRWEVSNACDVEICDYHR